MEKCKIELSLLYPPVSCLKRIDELKIYFPKKAQLLRNQREEYHILCRAYTPTMGDINWIEKSLSLKVGGDCERALVRRRKILKYRFSQSLE